MRPQHRLSTPLQLLRGVSLRLMAQMQWRRVELALLESHHFEGNLATHRSVWFLCMIFVTN